MPEHLWFLRHGEAEPHDARPDERRVLTPRGEAQARAAGRALATLELTFQHVASSPRVRALDTARLACASLGDRQPVVHGELGSDFGADQALEIASAAGTDKRVLVVGHNPDFEQVLHDLTGARVALKKGGIAGVRLQGRRGTLIVLLRPREIDRLGC